MEALLDMHELMWWVMGHERISTRLRRLIGDADQARAERLTLVSVDPSFAAAENVAELRRPAAVM